MIEREEWFNLNAFLARVTAEHIQDYSHFALWLMRHTFEEDEERSTKEFEMWLIGTAQWIFHAGPLLYANPDYSGPGSAPGDAWSGPDGFSRQRWEFWRQSYQRAAKMNSLRSRTRTVAVEAASVMASIEQEGR